MAFRPVAVIAAGLEFENRGRMILCNTKSMINPGARIPWACSRRMPAAMDSELIVVHGSRGDVNEMAERRIVRPDVSDGKGCSARRDCKHCRPWRPKR